MNAVAAVLGAADAGAARASVQSMLNRMPARGAGLRLIAESPLGVAGVSGRAPASSARAGGTRLVGDLRLDNADDVRRALGLDRDVTSAAIALEAYARWGVAFAARLAGDFAFVIFDPDSARVVAVRDALGIRPLYYRGGPHDVRIASELAALVGPGDAVDEGFLAEAIAGDVVDLEGTPYDAIKRVPAAHALVVTGSSRRLVRYWEPSTDILSGSPSEHAERFRAAFDEAVRAACAGEARVGVHLSGGLDSSSVLGSVMANGFAAPLAGSILLPWPEADERAWIDAAAARWSLTPILISPPVDPAAHGLGDIAVHRDLPDVPASGPLLAPLHQALRDAGMDTVLTGFGGDQWWSGEMAHMADLLHRFDFAGLRAWRRAGPAMGDVAWSRRAFVSSGILPHVPAAAKRLVRRVAPAPLPSWVAPDFAVRVGLRDRVRRRHDTRHAPSESWRHLRWRLSSGEEALTKERIDRMAVAHGVELRHPLYDRRLVDLAFVTPDSARLAGGRSRVVMREAMSDRLSPETRGRHTKAELSMVLMSAAQQPDVDPHLSLSNLTARGWVAPRESAAIVEGVKRRGQVDNASAFWSLVGVEAWLAEVFR